MALGATLPGDWDQRVGIKIKRPAALVTCLLGCPCLRAWGVVVCIGDFLPSCGMVGGSGLQAHPSVADQAHCYQLTALHVGTCTVGAQAVITPCHDALPCVMPGAALGDGR
jgi:hypothetical protein